VSAYTRDWDAQTYDRVSGPQVAWAERVLERLPLHGDETVLDAGCGSGRVTRMLLERLPRGHVVAVDASPSMVERARAALGECATVLCQDLARLRLDEPVDAAFSNAVFHWVPDHDALFARLAEALRPGGRLVAQCGGRGNIDALRDVAREVAGREPYAPHLADWPEPWNYASPEETADRLERAGLEPERVWLEPWPVRPPEPASYLRSVCLGPYVERLPDALRDAYVADVRATAGEPLVLDYVRLNIDARRPA
jgi:trans-aconitate 2-methyltransferase